MNILIWYSISHNDVCVSVCLCVCVSNTSGNQFLFSQSLGQVKGITSIGIPTSRVLDNRLLLTRTQRIVVCSTSPIFETIDQYNSEFYELCGVLNSQGSFQSMYSDIFPSLGSWYQFFVLGPCKVMVSLEMFIYEAYVYV